jgi:hypothetical protein
LAGQFFPLDLCKNSSSPPHALSVVSILILHLFLWLNGYCSAGAIISLVDGYQELDSCWLGEYCVPLDSFKNESVQCRWTLC